MSYEHDLAFWKSADLFLRTCNARKLRLPSSLAVRDGLFRNMMLFLTHDVSLRLSNSGPRQTML